MNEGRTQSQMLVAIQPRKQQDLGDGATSSLWTYDPTVVKIDFVHGSFDFIITPSGAVNQVNKRI
jgi:hypothetical protein